MKGLIPYFLFILLPWQLCSQHKVTFVVSDLSPIKHDSIFIAGTFNNWDSLSNEKFKLERNDERKFSIQLNLPPGNYAYKYTGGNWLTVEKSNYGEEQNDRPIQVRGDTIVFDTVWYWRELLPRTAHYKLSNILDDTTRMNMLWYLAATYSNNPDFYNIDSAAYYMREMNVLFQKMKSSDTYASWKGYNNWLIYTQDLNATNLHSLGNYTSSLELHFENLERAEQMNNFYAVLSICEGIIQNYLVMKDYKNALVYSRKMYNALSKADPSDEQYRHHQSTTFLNLAKSYYNTSQQDSALFYIQKTYDAGIKGNHNYILAASTQLLGDIYSQKRESDSAFHYYKLTAPAMDKTNMYHLAAKSSAGMARLFQKEGQIDSAIIYARQALSTLIKNRLFITVWKENADAHIADISPLLAELYKEQNELDSAYKYLRLSVTLKDSLYNLEKIRQFQDLSFNESLRQQQMEQQALYARKALNTKIKLYGLLIGLSAFLVIALILFRNNRQKQQANQLLSKQKLDLEKAISDLHLTQKQLVQSEKMASLGELTAGIAHEIQNPLNFVNNFSEVNTELLDELTMEIKKGNLSEAVVIAHDIKENEQKITHHGQRADAIVKGMLLHSRSSTGHKELTDINALADEYLRLAYHGLRAKDKSFNASMQTDFDGNIGKINVIPQEIGRVMLNLITNAFYAVSEKSKKGIPEYAPEIIVRSRKSENHILLSVLDNGNGIPTASLGKIFQPFFTTKPVGEGTGLGLSISYDIIKAHGGELRAETKEGHGTEFIIQLPILKNLDV